MKKLVTIVLFILIFSPAQACDICGCGSGNSYIGILPDFRRHIAGLRYRSNSLLTHLGVDGQRTYLTAREQYRTVEAWGGWNLGQRFRVMASLPYSINRKTDGQGGHSQSGLGDASAWTYYSLLNQRRSVGDSLLVHTLWLGGGLKLPTGSYRPQDKPDAVNNANLFQLGTGSTDLQAGLMYDLRLQDAGLNLSSNYRWNTVNRDGYEYGDKFSLNTQLYYKIRVAKKLTAAPNAGLQFERSARDRDGGLAVAASGGRLWLATAGLETSIGSFAAGANLQLPVAQSLARGMVQAGNRVMVHLAVAL